MKQLSKQFQHHRNSEPGVEPVPTGQASSTSDKLAQLNTFFELKLISKFDLTIILIFAILVLTSVFDSQNAVLANAPWIRNCVDESSQLSRAPSKPSPTANLILDPYAARKDRQKTNSIPRHAIREISRRIDELANVSSETQHAQIRSISDHKFLRRVYLDIAGRIPTLDESNSFLESESDEKRFDLIDELLDSEAFVSHQFNYFADLFRLQSRNRIGSDQPFLNYVRESLANNKPYDKFVHEMLVAEGPYYKPGNGATGYLLRDYSMPEVSMSNTIRIFLGTRLECAQCHDHPTDKWTQRQYFEMVAFFGGMAYRINNTESIHDAELDKIAKNQKYSDNTRRFMRQSIIPLRFGLRGSGQGMARLPEGYQYSDGEENEVVYARTMFDNIETRNETKPDSVPPPEKSMAPERTRHRIANAHHIGSRKTLADWMTSTDNQRFATVIANRLWKQAMGVGVVEPIDNITDDTLENSPELLQFLAQTIVRLQFDTKQLLRIVYYTRTYQQETLVDDKVGPHSRNIANTQPRLRRMSAEQVWDSLLALTIDNVDKPRELFEPTPNFLGKYDIGESYEALTKLTPDEFEEIVLNNISLRDNNPDYPRHVFRIDSRPGVNRRHLIFNELTGDELMRASFLMSPMPPNHLLRDFGQSDREAINNGNREISTAQILQFVNGFVEQKMVDNADSVINQNLATAKDNQQRIEMAYMSVLGRQPTPKESQQWLNDFDDFGSETLGDLVWTLVNSTEFLFIQ